MKTILLLLLVTTVLFSPDLTGQEKRDYIWIFADDDHPNDNMGEGIIMDFNTMPVIPEFLDKEMQINFTGAVISNSDGELLFYTNGCYIANNEHKMMENGDGLNPGLGYDLNCAVGGYTVVQGALILPIPESNNEYLIFHTQLKVVSNPTDLLPFLLYTRVDMTANGDLGRVIEKNMPVLSDTLDAGLLTAVKHVNNKDWWIIVAERFSSRHYRMLITEHGISSITEQVAGLPSTFGGQGGGWLFFRLTAINSSNTIRSMMCIFLTLIGQLVCFQISFIFPYKTALLPVAVRFRPIIVFCISRVNGICTSLTYRPMI